MKTTLTIILTLYSCLLCAQPSDMDIMFEGYEDSRLYDNWEYVLYHKTQSKACEEASLPPSVYLKLWDKDRGTVANPIDSSYVNLYWICPREFTEESRTLWKKMAKKWGIRRLSLYMKEDRKDSVVNFTLDAIPAKWMYNDTLMASHNVKHYGDSWVAEPNAAFVIAPHNGKMRESSCNGLVEDRSRLLSDCDMIINTIHTKLTTLRWKTKLDDPKENTQILNLFARDITRFMPENAPKDIERKYNITLLIDSIGRPHLYQYHDHVKDSVDSVLLSGLDASIEANHYDTFRRMLTVEGDIFPWRYIRASYIKGTWYFMDYIWTEEEKRKYYMLRDDLNPMVQTCIETNWKLNDKK